MGVYVLAGIDHIIKESLDISYIMCYQLYVQYKYGKITNLQ